jgi:signal transduction histidine kinase/CheY-like chemotaxis protein
VPHQSKDSALTAFAQLAALRLDASRALVSLIDSKHQYILAESTRSVSLQSDGRKRSHDPLWLGTVTIPRSKGVCGLALENALQASSTAPAEQQDNDASDITVIENLQEDLSKSNATYIVPNAGPCSYVGMPIRTSDGAIIGMLSIFDDKPRSALDDDQQSILRDISKTIMQHLDSVRINYAHDRTNKLLTGLESFVDGLANTRTSKEAADNRTADLPEPGAQLAAHDVAAEGKRPLLQHRISSQGSLPSPSIHDAGPQHLWDLAMPAGSKPMFARAANVMRQSGGYDGCAIFYVPSRKTRSSRSDLRSGRTHHASDDAGVSHTDSSSSPERTGTSSDTDAPTHVDQLSPRSVCPLLSCSFAPNQTRTESKGPFARFRRRDLEKLLGKSPRARTYTLNKAGDILPGDSSSSGSGFDQSDSSNAPGSDQWNDNADQGRLQKRLLLEQIKALKKIDPNALSYVCLPLWDFERQRWLAFCVCWTSSPARHLKLDGDLGYLRVFANSIAVSLSHIDAIASNRSKSTFVSSISHELRSPLHGILSATNFLRDGNLSRFEQEMIGVISSCGRTLLDTIDHVMDFAKISSAAPRKHQRTPTGSLANGPPQAADRELGSSMSTRVNLANLVEEVVEAVLMGYSVQHDFLYAEDDELASMSTPTNHHSAAHPLPRSRSIANTRGRIRLVLDIPYRGNWHVYTQPGAWRRVIMNLFGNSLKYTNSGIVMVRIIPTSDPSGSSLSVRLNILDTGKGIAKHYLDTRLYKAFSQEDQLSSGTGLGLAIVKQVVDSLEGEIDLQSIQGQGTSVGVDLSVPLAEVVPSLFETSDLSPDLLERLRGRQVYILEDASTETVGQHHTSSEAENELLATLTSTLKGWFEIEVTSGAVWPTSGPDLVILLKPWLKYFEKGARDDIFRQPILLVAYDALEMAVLRTNARISRDDAIIEVTSQPLGPYKLGRMLKQCLERYDQLLAAYSRPASATPPFGKSPSNLSLVRSATPQDHRSPAPSESRRKSSELYRDPFVLIVDDNPLNLRLLSVFIERQSLKYHEAVNGQEAVDIFRVAKRSVRCILMDISMPVLDGIAATRLIREVEQQEGLERTPIAALTGLTSAASRSEAQEAGMDDFLTKPISFAQLGNILKGVKGL